MNALDTLPTVDYAEAINAAVDVQIEQARDLGGLLAQAGMTPASVFIGPHQRFVVEGYLRQKRDFPNG